MAKKAAHPLIEEMDLFIKSNGIKKQEFYKRLGYSGTYIQMLRRGDRPVSEDAKFIIQNTIQNYFTMTKENNDMDNAELWTAIVKAGEAYTVRSTSKLWKEAFERYNKATKETLQMTCGRCVDKVKTWLKTH